MANSTTRTILGLNILGTVCGLSAAAFLYVFFFIGESVDSNYYLGSFFTSLIAAILSFGFSHMIRLLADLRDKIHRGD